LAHTPRRDGAVVLVKFDPDGPQTEIFRGS
jgi:hypothetical protein